MSILKKILIGAACLLALPFIAALFIPTEYTLSASENIKQPKSVVFEYMKSLKNQENYSVWVMADPTLHPEIVGEDGTVGAIQKWNSKDDNIGEGEQEITALTPDRITVDLRFKRPFESTAKAATLFVAVSDTETKVTSEFYGKDAYPMNLMSYLFGWSIIEKAEAENLKNLKKILEK